MKGHVRKRGSKWAFVIDIGKDPATGRRKQKWFSGYRTKREAEKAMTEKIAEISKGDYIEPSRQPFRDLLREWLEVDVRNRLSGRTYDMFEYLIRVYIVPRIGDVPLDKLSPLHIQKFYNDLLDTEKIRGGGKLSPTTIRHIHKAVYSSLKWGVRMRIVPRNVAENVQPPKRRKSEIKVWTQEEAAEFLSVCKGHRLYAFYYLALSTGMRRGELLGLRWEDVDLERGIIMVRRTLVRKGTSYEVEEEPKTASSRRSIHISPQTIEVLKQHRTKQKEELLRLGMTNPEYVFLSIAGKFIEPSYVRKTFRKLIEKAKVPLIRIHDLRHTHATFLLQQGVHPKVVSERLGHASISMTMDLYSHVTPNMQKEAAMALQSFEDSL